MKVFALLILAAFFTPAVYADRHNDASVAAPDTGTLPPPSTTVAPTAVPTGAGAGAAPSVSDLALTYAQGSDKYDNLVTTSTAALEALKNPGVSADVLAAQVTALRGVGAVDGPKMNEFMDSLFPAGHPNRDAVMRELARQEATSLMGRGTPNVYNPTTGTWGPADSDTARATATRNITDAITMLRSNDPVKQAQGAYLFRQTFGASAVPGMFADIGSTVNASANVGTDARGNHFAPGNNGPGLIYNGVVLPQTGTVGDKRIFGDPASGRAVLLGPGGERFFVRGAADSRGLVDVVGEGPQGRPTEVTGGFYFKPGEAQPRGNWTVASGGFLTVTPPNFSRSGYAAAPDAATAVPIAAPGQRSNYATTSGFMPAEGTTITGAEGVRATRGGVTYQFRDAAAATAFATAGTMPTDLRGVGLVMDNGQTVAQYAFTPVNTRNPSFALPGTSQTVSVGAGGNFSIATSYSDAGVTRSNFADTTTAFRPTTGGTVAVASVVGGDGAVTRHVSTVVGGAGGSVATAVVTAPTGDRYTSVTTLNPSGTRTLASTTVTGTTEGAPVGVGGWGRPGTYEFTVAGPPGDPNTWTQTHVTRQGGIETTLTTRTSPTMGTVVTTNTNGTRVELPAARVSGNSLVFWNPATGQPENRTLAAGDRVVSVPGGLRIEYGTSGRVETLSTSAMPMRYRHR